MENTKVIGKIVLPEPKVVEKCSCCGTKYRLLVNSDGLICDSCWDDKVQQELDSWIEEIELGD